MPTSDEELAQLQTSVEEKRVRLADARRAREDNERALANDVVAAQLLAEAAQLDVMIASEEKSATTEAVIAGASGLMDQVVADLGKAQAQAAGAEEMAALQEANRAEAEAAAAAEQAQAVAAAEAALAAANSTEGSDQ